MDDRMEIFKLAQSYKIKWKLFLDSKVYEVLTAHAHSLGCELDLMILPLLVSVASSMTSGTKVQVTPSWFERPCLCGIVAARRGERKTTMLNYIKSCCRQVKRCGGDTEGTGSESGIPVIDESFTKNIAETCKSKDGRVYVLDDLDIVLKDVTEMPDIWNLRTLQKLFSSGGSDQTDPIDSVNVIAAAQAVVISDVINSHDPGRLLDRVIVYCARDSDDMVIPTNPPDSLGKLMQRIYDTHVNQNVTYSFSEEATQEFQRMSGNVNAIKKQCHNDELKRGCCNHVMSQMARLSAVLCALTSSIKETKADFTINKTTTQSMFVVSLYLLRQKCLLLHGSDSTTYSELFNSILNRETELLPAADTSPRESEDDVIEITLDRNNEPVARIIPKREDCMEISETSPTADVRMWTMENKDYTINQNERDTSSVYYPTVQNLPQEVVTHPKRQRLMNRPTGSDTEHCQQYEHNHPSHNGDSKQIQFTNTLHPRGKFRPPPPPLKLRPHQLHVNRRFIPAPKRLTDRTQSKTCVFTCSDSLFLHICCAKIRKCLLTKGLSITSSYACQYRLFPPVPLTQRTSSPRTTHPSWAAVKFFERLEALGYGEVTVFRSQSVKFRKKPLEEMTEEARDILKYQIGITEEEYRSAMTKEEDVPGPAQEYNYVFTVHQNGDIETEHMQQVENEQNVQHSA